MPIVRRNNWTDNAADIEDAQLQTAGQVNRVAVGIERLTENQPNPDVVIDRLNGIAGATGALADAAIRGFDDLGQRMGQTVEAVLTVARQIDLVAIETARAAAAAEKIAHRLDEREGRETDLCTAFYAAAVDIDGRIDRRTHLGELLIEAKYESLAEFGERPDFIDGVQTHFKGQQGKNKERDRELADFMTAEILGCVWERARGVTKALKRLNPGRPKKAAGSNP